MEFCTLTKDEFNKFASNHEQASFLQNGLWGDLRTIYGSKIFYLGIKENNNIIAAAMLSEDKVNRFFTRLYSPRGYIIDYHNEEVLKFFTDNIRKFAKKRKATFVRIDPNVIYQIRDIDGNETATYEKDNLSINNLKKLGYIHSGFTKEIGQGQSRWNFRLTLDRPYEELENNFSKSTRKNIQSTYKKGMRVRKASIEDLESMEDILVKTAERKNFAARSLNYYTNMFNVLKDQVSIYIAYLDPDIYIDETKKILEESKSKLAIIKEKMTKDMVGSKLKNQEKTILETINKYEEELKIANKFKNENPHGKDIGTLISLKSGEEYLTLYSGILMEYKRFTPKYLMYSEHIKDAYKYGFKYVNFYGITGKFNPDDKDYGMYEFKRGFGGKVVEMIGEFTLPTSNKYIIYKMISKLKGRI